MAPRDIKQRVPSAFGCGGVLMTPRCSKKRLAPRRSGPPRRGTASTKRRFYNYFGDAEGAGLALLSGGLTPSSSTSKINIELGAISGPTERSPYARFGGMKN